MTSPYVLLGTAIGDALGKPFEMKHAEDPMLEAWDGKSYLSGGFENLGEEGKKPGAWTDDTQMSLALAQSLVAQQDYNPGKVAESYLEWFQGRSPWGSHRGMGGTVRHAMKHLASDPTDSAWRNASKEFRIGDAVGCGSAMRAGVFGAFCKDTNETMMMAEADAQLTHKHPEGRAGSIAIALHVFFCRAHNEIPPMVTQAKIIHHLEERGYRHTMVVRGLRFARLLASWDWATKRSDAILELGASGLVWEAVPSALFCYYFPGDPDFFLNQKYYADHKLNILEHVQMAYKTAVKMGGDTDSRAAMVGAMLGARYGKEGLQEYIPGLEKADEIMALDEALMKRTI